MLTEKQREAVVQVARGETSEHAAVILDMDVHAYRDRVRKAKAALGAKNAAHLVALAMARGIITRKDLT